MYRQRRRFLPGRGVARASRPCFCPVDGAHDITDSTFGVPNDALRRRIMDYLASIHNATSNVAYGWPARAGMLILHYTAQPMAAVPHCVSHTAPCVTHNPQPASAG